MDQQIVGAGRSMEFSVIKPRFFATRHRNISLQECLLSPLHRSAEALTTEQPRLPYGESKKLKTVCTHVSVPIFFR